MAHSQSRPDSFALVVAFPCHTRRSGRPNPKYRESWRRPEYGVQLTGLRPATGRLLALPLLDQRSNGRGSPVEINSGLPSVVPALAWSRARRPCACRSAWPRPRSSLNSFLLSLVFPLVLSLFRACQLGIVAQRPRSPPSFSFCSNGSPLLPALACSARLPSSPPLEASVSSALPCPPYSTPCTPAFQPPRVAGGLLHHPRRRCPRPPAL